MNLAGKYRFADSPKSPTAGIRCKSQVTDDAKEYPFSGSKRNPSSPSGRFTPKNERIGKAERLQKPANSGRLKASTLVEVLVSLTLASIVFVIGGMVWLQLNGNTAPHRQLEQRLFARELIDEAIQNGERTDQVFMDGATKFVRKIKIINPETQLAEITVSVFGLENTPLFTRGVVARLENH